MQLGGRKAARNTHAVIGIGSACTHAPIQFVPGLHTLDGGRKALGAGNLGYAYKLAHRRIFAYLEQVIGRAGHSIPLEHKG